VRTKEIDLFRNLMNDLLIRSWPLLAFDWTGGDVVVYVQSRDIG
jgi:hypothetical protein